MEQSAEMNLHALSSFMDLLIVNYIHKIVNANLTMNKLNIQSLVNIVSIGIRLSVFSLLQITTFFKRITKT